MSQQSARLSFAREPFGLLEEEAHVWAVPLDIDENRLRNLDGVLSPDERERAARFAISLHGKRFVAARGILRTILSRYAGAAPAEIRFSYGPHGKPFLSPEAGRGEIHFNVSHAADRALIAVTKGREIGVDIESIGERPFDMGIVRRFFSPREGAVLLSAPEAARASLFAAIWTRKEACIKASGLGLSFRSLRSTSRGTRENLWPSRPAWMPPRASVYGLSSTSRPFPASPRPARWRASA